jgi:hypothetical protein
MTFPIPDIDYAAVYTFLMGTSNARGVQIPGGVAYTTNWTVTHGHGGRVDIEATVKLQTTSEDFHRSCEEVRQAIMSQATPEERVILEEGFRKLTL